MHEMTVYSKSAKGREEIATRSHKLPFKHRTLLIMVDGVCSLAALISKAGHIGDVASMLSELRDQGFIEPVAPSAAEAAPAPAAAPKATPEQLGGDLSAAKLAAIKFLEKTLGPDAADFAVRIEECRTREDFVRQVETCRETLKRVTGNKSADDFWREINEHVAEAV